MSSHVTMKTTRNTTQDAFRQPHHFLSGARSWNDLKSGFSAFVTHKLTQGSSNLVQRNTCDFVSLHQPAD